MNWISTVLTPPPKNKPILINILDYKQESKIIKAVYFGEKKIVAAFDFDEGEYDEQTDTYYCPEGWYESDKSLIDVRGFRLIGVNGLFIHVLEHPFIKEPSTSCSVVHVESGKAIGICFSLTDCYELIQRLKHLDWTRSGVELQKDKAFKAEVTKIVKLFTMDVEALEGVL